MFLAVVESLLDSSAAGSNAEDSLGRLVDHFERLQSILASRGGLLSGESVRGLFAELLLLLELREAGYTAEAAVMAWQGPYRVAKDFILDDGRCIEVKSLRQTNHRIKISNVDQLDPRDEELRVAVVPLERCAPDDGRAFLDLIAEVSAWMKESSTAQEYFDQALETLGLDIDDPHYRRWHFRHKNWKWFAVSEGFPRIRAVDVPSAVTHVSYTLDIDVLRDFVSDSFWAEKN